MRVLRAPIELMDEVVGQPLSNVALGMQNTPDIDVVIALDVEHQVGVTLQRPAEQPRQIQIVAIAADTRCRMATDMRVALLKRIDESDCDLLCSLSKVVTDSMLDIFTREDSGNHWLDRCLHPLRAFARSDSK